MEKDSITIQPIVVVYNTDCADSVSVQALIQQGMKPMIVDNSTGDYGNQGFCDSRKLKYISMGGNAGLTKAYNRALDEMDEDVDYILWMDDDTSLPPDFLQCIKSKLAECPDTEILLPLVKSDNRDYLSPNIMENMRPQRIRKADELEGKRISAINSGMLVKKTVYDRYRYDEKLFLDCVDHDFMNYCYENDIKIAVDEKNIIFQHFSGDEADRFKRKLRRYRMYSKDYRYFRKKSGCSIAATEVLLFKRLLNIVIQSALSRGRCR